MKKQIGLSLIAGCAMTLITSAVFADDDVAPTTITTPISTIVRNLLQAGDYVAVQEVKFKEGFYNAEAINIQGEKVDVRLDPETGKIIEPRSTKPAMTMLTAIKKVEEAGYHNIYKIESEGNEYQVKAVGKDGKNANLKVDAFNDSVTKKLSD